MITLWNDSPADLVRLADVAQLAYLQRRWQIAERGYRQQRLRALQKAVTEMLERDGE